MKKGGIMYVARDKDGDLFLHGEKPYKYQNGWRTDIHEKMFIITWLPSSMFPEVKWEDEEPTEVELIIKPKK